MSLSKKNFWKKLKAQKHEDIPSIQYIEKSLMQKRGYIFKKPRPGTPVILLLSGGLDSITTWNILLEEHKLTVYPLSINNSPKRRVNELRSISFFSNYFAQKYPLLYKKPFFIEMRLKELHIPIEKAPRLLHSQSLLEQVDQFGHMKSNLSLGSFSLDPFIAKMYSKYVYLREHIHLTTCFCAITSSDGAHIPEQRYGSLRSSMWQVVQSTEYRDWQFVSAIFESGMKTYWSKADLIRWAFKNSLPLDKTWSCYRGGGNHCGYCYACYARRKAFHQAHVGDTTMYDTEKISWWEKIRKLLTFY